MGFLDTPHKKKSAMLTSIITLLLLLVFSWIGLSYFDPPISYGMEVNFGMATQGKGTTQAHSGAACVLPVGCQHAWREHE